jgi:hypothetical protein
MAKKPEDYRVTRGKAMIAEKKRVAANPQKGVGLPSKKNVVNAAKQIGGAALMIAGPGKVVKGVQAATKVAKAAKAAKAMGKLTKDEKYAVKFVKDIAKKGKPGDVKLTLDSMPSGLKKDFSKALTKAAGDKSAVYKQNPRASAKAIVVQSRSTGKTKRININ